MDLVFRKFIIISFSLFTSTVSAQKIVSTAKELQDILVEDREQGVILLNGDLFHIAGVEVKAGGTIKPYPGRKPVLIGFHQEVKRGNHDIDVKGYWSVPIKSYGYSQIVFLDNKLDTISYACHINGMDGYNVMAKQIEIIKRPERLVKIPIAAGFEYLKNRDMVFFKNFSIKIGFWFVGMSFNHIFSDGEYLYGNIDSDYNLNLLLKRPSERVRLEFFNLPQESDGIFLDGNDILHVPEKYDVVRVCATPPILKLVGNREITFENITFTGANGDALVLQGSNKHFEKCVFRNCGSAIVASNGLFHNCMVVNCLVENLYNNTAFKLNNVNDVVVEGNTICHTGTLMKGGSVITVGGMRFIVRNNNISDYSYIGINAGLTRDYRPGTVGGIIADNVIDNRANYGDADKQLTDGGGIYVLTHTDGVIIENNIVRNVGYEGCELWGIYLDDGAYNCTVRRNLVYNLWPGQYALTARYVDECERSCMNNIVENNILIGPCKIAGNRKGLGNKTIIRNNYITGDLITQGDEYVSLDGNKFISTIVGKDGRILSEKGSRIKKRGFTRNIKRLIKR